MMQKRKVEVVILVSLVFLSQLTVFHLVPNVNAQTSFQISTEKNDGYVTNSGTNYATVQGATSGGASTTSTTIGQNFALNKYYVWRGFFNFNTSSIGAGATITVATLQLYGKTDGSATDFGIRVQAWITTDSVIDAEAYDEFDGTNYDDGLFSTSAFTTSGYNNITITNFNCINKIGNTTLCVRSAEDIATSLPTNAENVGISDVGEGSNQYATLSVTWTSSGDTTKPTYSSISTNTTLRAMPCSFNIYITDETALHPNGQYIFGCNTTGPWVNDTAANFTATPQWANVTSHTLNDTVGIVVQYEWWFTDNAGNSNNTGVQSLTVTAYLVTYTFPESAKSTSTQQTSLALKFTFPELPHASITTAFTKALGFSFPETSYSSAVTVFAQGLSFTFNTLASAVSNFIMGLSLSFRFSDAPKASAVLTPHMGLRFSFTGTGLLSTFLTSNKALGFSFLESSNGLANFLLGKDLRFQFAESSLMSTVFSSKKELGFSLLEIGESISVFSTKKALGFNFATTGFIFSLPSVNKELRFSIFDVGYETSLLSPTKALGFSLFELGYSVILLSSNKHLQYSLTDLATVTTDFVFKKALEFNFLELPSTTSIFSFISQISGADTYLFEFLESATSSMILTHLKAIRFNLPEVAFTTSTYSFQKSLSLSFTEKAMAIASLLQNKASLFMFGQSGIATENLVHNKEKSFLLLNIASAASNLIIRRIALGFGQFENAKSSDTATINKALQYILNEQGLTSSQTSLLKELQYLLSESASSSVQTGFAKQVMLAFLETASSHSALSTQKELELLFSEMGKATLTSEELKALNLFFSEEAHANDQSELSKQLTMLIYEVALAKTGQGTQDFDLAQELQFVLAQTLLAKLGLNFAKTPKETTVTPPVIGGIPYLPVPLVMDLTSLYITGVWENHITCTLIIMSGGKQDVNVQAFIDDKLYSEETLYVPEGPTRIDVPFVIGPRVIGYHKLTLKATPQEVGDPVSRTFEVFCMPVWLVVISATLGALFAILLMWKGLRKLLRAQILKALRQVRRNIILPF
jgi:hypothetical protein